MHGFDVHPHCQKEKNSDSDPLCVRIGTAGLELRGANEIGGDGDSVGGKWEGGTSPTSHVDIRDDVVNRADKIASDDESWTGHSYASDGGDSGSIDSGLVVEVTDDNGKGLMNR